MEISFEDWQKMDFRIGEIKEVKDHPNADKLVVLKVDIGSKVINLVAGIKQWYKKDDLLNKKIVVFTNLNPVELRGIKSEGMLLAAEDKGRAVLLIPEEDVNNGSKIR